MDPFLKMSLKIMFTMMHLMLTAYLIVGIVTLATFQTGHMPSDEFSATLSLMGDFILLYVVVTMEMIRIHGRKEPVDDADKLLPAVP